MFSVNRTLTTTYADALLHSFLSSLWIFEYHKCFNKHHSNKSDKETTLRTLKTFFLL